VAILGLLRPDTRIRVAQLAAELGCTEAELASDLETLSMCGVAPFTPDMYMPVFVEDGYVEVLGELPALDGPVRLSASEATALAAALQSAGFDASDDLTQRVLRASAAPTFSALELESVVRTAGSAHSGDVYETLAKAVADAEVVRIEYCKPESEEPSARDVEPHVIFTERGVWYLIGFSRRAGGWRTFRLDRIRSAQATGDSIARASEARFAGMTTALDTRELPVARLRFADATTFSDREWPGAAVVAEEDGTLVVEVPYSGTDWMARHVVARLGGVEVLDPPAMRDAVRSLADRLSAQL
jgi:proteasome accessory factor C